MSLDAAFRRRKKRSMHCWLSRVEKHAKEEVRSQKSQLAASFRDGWRMETERKFSTFLRRREDIIVLLFLWVQNYHEPFFVCAKISKSAIVRLHPSFDFSLTFPADGFVRVSRSEDLEHPPVGGAAQLHDIAVLFLVLVFLVLIVIVRVVILVVLVVILVFRVVFFSFVVYVIRVYSSFLDLKVNIFFLFLLLGVYLVCLS